MPWLRFSADFNYRLRDTVRIAYRGGKSYLVSQACARAALAAGRAELTERPDQKHAFRIAAPSRRILSTSDE